MKWQAAKLSDAGEKICAAVDPLTLVNTASQKQLLADLELHLIEGRGFAVATLNLDHIVKLKKDPVFRTAYEVHSHVVADGNPVVWLSKLAGQPAELVPGSELIEPLAALAARLEIPVALIGATDATLQSAASRLTADNEGLEIVSCIAPPFGFDPDSEDAGRLLNAVSASGARLCFVALGAPKQERLAARAINEWSGAGYVSIGAGLDFIAGTQKRAPGWVRYLAAEWVWRMLGSPRRLAGRYMKCILIMPGLTVAALRRRWR